MRIAAPALALSLLAAPANAAEEPSEPFTLTTVAEGLQFPWCLAFLPDGAMLVTERGGTLRIVREGTLEDTPIAGVPEVYVKSQAGLFDVLPHPDFANNKLLFLSFAHGTDEENATRVVRATFDGTSLSNVETIFTASPTKNTAAHYGGRMLFLPDGTLLVTLGDGFNFREEAQNLGSHFGAIVRINIDGTVPPDNPFIGKEGARPEIWSYGHRNVQGIARDPGTGRIYANEHGPRGGDEVNIIEPGLNFGWPVITYGVDYTGARISPFTEYPGMEQPFLDWTPSIAPSSLAFYTGDAFPKWKGDLFTGALAFRELRRVDLEDGKVVGEETLLRDLDERIRDVRQGPDGKLYVLIEDAEDGKIARLDPVP
ncbi:MAG: PQQ-dependent sugar dehydrogenase [Alphaproteobacteria bacterium]|nr:PQQ-dependent sugar dehydrogenase [Alphaproteobacteria bacterium]